MTLRIGTRGSALALAQCGDVAELITERTGIATELVPVTTHGDVSQASLSSLGGTGVFASALREALLGGACDIVVHSMKDLPTAAYPGLIVAAVPEREDARDALCARDGLTLDELPLDARVGTGSPRRAAQLLAHRPDLVVVDIRGNVDTRLGFVSSGELDAVVLAVAGLTRLGRTEAITEIFELDTWPTAAAQGALAIEALETLDPAGEDDVARAVRAINDADAFVAAHAERSVLAGLEAGCSAPVGASAQVGEDTLRLTASVYAGDGSSAVSDDAVAMFSKPIDVSDPTELDGAGLDARIAVAGRTGFDLAASLLSAGAPGLADRP
nr:hydroxymethylbilane synthase [Labedella endophytica]